MSKRDLLSLADKAIKVFSKETKDLEYLSNLRYNKSWFPNTGMYDWFSSQLLYCLLRYIKPKQIIEVSTSSGYSTLFTALALKKNKGGRIDTFELDEKVYRAAKKNFKRFQVDKYVNAHLGDAKEETKKIKDLSKVDIFFLDSLHNEQFARWFIDSLVLKSKDSALFHMHDILPTHARVRKSGGPPWGFFSLHTYHKASWKILNLLQGTPLDEFKKFNIKKPDKKGALFTYDGNESLEAALGNRLTALMPRGSYFYNYDIANKYKDILNSRQFDKITRFTQNELGESYEWNASLWAKCGDLKKAYKKVPKSLQ